MASFSTVYEKLGEEKSEQLINLLEEMALYFEEEIQREEKNK